MSSSAKAVMLHGWGSHGAIWQEVASHMPEAVMALDFPGYGTQSSSLCPDSLDALAEYSLERAPRQAVWAGWSLGGMVAMRAAILAPERVKGLVLVCSTPKFVKGPDWQWGTDIELFDSFVEGLNADYHKNMRRFLLLQAGDARLARQLSKPIAEIIDSAAQPSSRTLLNGLAILESVDLRNQLSGISSPMRVIAGELDRICHPQASTWLTELLDGELRSIRCGHCPLLSHPADVATELSSLIGEVFR